MHVGRVYPRDPAREIKAQAALDNLAWRESSGREFGDPFGHGIIADMRGVAQQFQRLQRRVENGAARRDHIHEDGAAARHEHALHFFQRA